MSPRRLEDQDDSCCTTCSFQSSNPPQQQQFLRIATWEAAARTLASYVEMYHMLHPEAPRILIHSVPSIEELQNSINLMTASPVETRLDGFVVPPVLLGSLADELVTIEPNDSTQYLPLYEQLTTVDGRRAALPLFSGNQLLLFYRRDLLDVLNLPPPSSWKEVAYIAKNLHGAKVDDATTLSGLCLGLMSEQACRQQASATGMPCHSQSMTYWGTILASMTQSQGSESGWLWDADIRNGLKPLLNATLERTLELLEEQLLYSSTDELQTDASLSLERFQQGVCAMTISADHPIDLLLDDNVGFVALPGSTQVLDRRSKTLKPCTFRSCPYRYGRANLNQSGEGVNQAPLGALDLAMGGIAASSYNQVAMREFLEFVETHRLNISVSAAPQQPLTYADLEHTSGTNPGLQAYTKLMEALTSDPNAALPLQIPTAFSLMSELDHQVYEYLLAENYNQANRKQVVRRIEQSWDIRIQQQDSRIHATPLSVLYKRSLQGPIGEELQDLYIGNTFRIIGWAMGGIACLLAVGFAIWVYVHQHERVIRASQPLFLWMVCAGAFIMASSIFPFGIEDDIVTTEGATVACMSSMWLYGVGFVMLVSALYSKIWRINRVRLSDVCFYCCIVLSSYLIASVSVPSLSDFPPRTQDTKDQDRTKTPHGTVSFASGNQYCSAIGLDDYGSISVDTGRV
jgi:ABC-type glycerol-3-phosphate transport system substrate-binding protein